MFGNLDKCDICCFGDSCTEEEQDPSDLQEFLTSFEWSLLVQSSSPFFVSASCINNIAYLFLGYLCDPASSILFAIYKAYLCSLCYVLYIYFNSNTASSIDVQNRKEGKKQLGIAHFIVLTCMLCIKSKKLVKKTQL